MNLGIKNLRAAAAGATIAEIADKLEIDRTYCGRILGEMRPAGLAFRKRARDVYGVALDDWDQEVPDPDHAAQAPNPTGTEG